MTWLAAVPADDPVWRIARAPQPWSWPDWAHAGHDGTFGNRFDDAQSEYRVLYACSQRLGCFIETLARFRPDPSVLAELAEIAADGEDPPTGRAGAVPLAWLQARSIGSGHAHGDYCDLGASASLAHLRGALAAELVRFGFDDLDAGDVRARAPRAFTQRISRYVFEHAGGTGRPLFAGIRYLSRLGDEFVNWAIFEPNEPESTAVTPLDQDDADFREALDRHGLHLSRE
jgi:hypothetical protein